MDFQMFLNFQWLKLSIDCSTHNRSATENFTFTSLSHPTSRASVFRFVLFQKCAICLCFNQIYAISHINDSHHPPYLQILEHTRKYRVYYVCSLVCVRCGASVCMCLTHIFQGFGWSGRSLSSPLPRTLYVPSSCEFIEHFSTLRLPFAC